MCWSGLFDGFKTATNQGSIVVFKFYNQSIGHIKEKLRKRKIMM